MARTIKLLISTAFSLAAMALHVASAETWYWSPKTKSGNYYYWNANNWTNAAGTVGRPALGDTVVLGWGTATDYAYQVCGSDANRALYEVRFEGNKVISMNQGTLYLQGGGGGLKYMHGSNCGGNWMGLRIAGSGEVPIHIDKSSATYALQGQMTITSGSNATLIKTGPGKFVCFNEAGARDYTIPLTLLRKGSIDITTAKSVSGVTIAFDGDDESQRIYFSSYNANHDLDLVLNNAGFYETNGVNNAAHGFSSPKDKQVKFTGTPKQNPTVFSGTFYSKAGLYWSPGSADYVFVCSNAVSATTGQMIVGKGTVKLVTGASFTALSKLTISAGATFEVEEGAGANFHADNMALANATAKVKVGTGVSLEMGAATLNGNALPRGTYTSDGGNDTRRAAWIEGAGTVVVVNGPDNIDTWSGAGADNLTSTDANWESGSAPDVTAGDLLATFATGGAEAMLPAGTPAAFDGLVLDAATLGGSSFAFTAGSGATATVGASGISVPAAAAATTWTMGWPFTVTGGAQAWAIGSNNTLKINAPWGGDQDITLTSDGTLELNATSTHSGALELQSGTVKVTATDGLGTSARTVNFHDDIVKLSFGGDITISSSLNGTWAKTDSMANGIKVLAGANVVFDGKLTYYSQGGVDLAAGSTATFRRGLQVSSSGMEGYLRFTGNGTAIITNAAMYIGQRTTSIEGSTMTLDLRVSDNNLTGGNRYWAIFPAATVVTRVANAISTGNSVAFGNGATFDLDGHNQSLKLFHGLAGSTVTSARPATLTLACNGNNESYNQGSPYNDTNRVNQSVFTGYVSLTKNGAYPHNLGATSSSTGTLKVTAGILTLSGSWPNCTNVVVSGGTFAVKNANAFGDADRAPGEQPKVVLNVAASGAALNLDYSGRIDCAEIHVDGEKSFGTFGAAGSGAEHEVAWITGTGFIRALPSGTVITFR